MQSQDALELHVFMPRVGTLITIGTPHDSATIEDDDRVGVEDLEEPSRSVEATHLLIRRDEQAKGQVLLAFSLAVQLIRALPEEYER
jgi:hypothetical protein